MKVHYMKDQTSLCDKRLFNKHLTVYPNSTLSPNVNQEKTRLSKILNCPKSKTIYNDMDIQSCKIY